MRTTCQFAFHWKVFHTLRLTITSITFVVSIAASLGFFLVYLIATHILAISTFLDRSAILKLEDEPFLDKIQSMPIVKFIIMTLTSIIFISLAVYLTVKNLSFPSLEIGISPALASAAIGFFAGFQYTLMRWPLTRNWFAMIVALIILVGAPTYLFDTTRYKQILSGLRYGGEVPITVTLRETEGKAHEAIHGVLLLRTSSALFIRPSSEGDTLEIQLDAIRHIVHH